ncbi:MAG: radical SAM protein [Nitrospirota bacterium]|nr:radical SAM protein [Nitrospirota bacterium]
MSSPLLEHTPSTEWRLWEKVGLGLIPPVDAIKTALSQRRWRFLAVDINGSCHYGCFFCESNNYYKGKVLLTDSEQEDLFRKLGELGEAAGTVVSLAGLEPLASPVVARKIPKLVRLLGQRQVVGLITAGKNLAEFSGLVADNIDFINISLDGPQSTHDTVRGEGAFNSASAGIEALLRRGFPADRIVPSSVACQNTWNQLPELWDCLKTRLGLTRFAANLVEADTQASWEALLSPKDACSLADEAIKSSHAVSIGISPRSLTDCGGFWAEIARGHSPLNNRFTYDALGFPIIPLTDRVSLRLVYSHLIYGKIAKIDATGEILVRHEDLTERVRVPLSNLARTNFEELSAAMTAPSALLINTLGQTTESICLGSEWHPLCLGSSLGCRTQKKEALCQPS